MAGNYSWPSCKVDRYSDRVFSLQVRFFRNGTVSTDRNRNDR
jgi:hypothetical protein